MESKPKLVAPSIFAADFYNLEKAVGLMQASGVDYIHYDIMDNHFVPNISFGPKLVADIAKKTALKSDVHLMIAMDTRDSLQTYLDMGVSNITLHLESTRHDIGDYLSRIRQAGISAGISIKPTTPVEAVVPYLDAVDLILVMSVEPGFSGQSFMEDSLSKLHSLKNLIGERTIRIQIDGGIARNNYRAVLDSGADFLVIGSAFFSDADPKEWVASIKS